RKLVLLVHGVGIGRVARQDPDGQAAGGERRETGPALLIQVDDAARASRPTRVAITGGGARLVTDVEPQATDALPGAQVEGQLGTLVRPVADPGGPGIVVEQGEDTAPDVARRRRARLDR